MQTAPYVSCVVKLENKNETFSGDLTPKGNITFIGQVYDFLGIVGAV